VIGIMLGVLGLGCLYLEFFVPGGILFFLGIVIALGSGFVVFWETSSYLYTTLYFLGLFLGAIGTCYLAIRHVKKSGRRNAFFLQEDQKGFVAAKKIDEELLGKLGVVITELKPAGHVRIEDRVYQAVSQGEFLPKDTYVEVISLQGAHLIVQKKK